MFTRPPVTALAATRTGMVIVQDPAAGIVVPIGSENDVAPGTAVNAPPQVVAPAGAAAIVYPAPIEARLSVNTAISDAATAAALLIVTVEHRRATLHDARPARTPWTR